MGHLIQLTCLWADEYPSTIRIKELFAICEEL